jgi:hypothetical protein
MTFKPKSTQVLIIKNHLILAGCADSKDYYSESLVVIKGKEIEEVEENAEEAVEEIEEAEEAVKPKKEKIKAEKEKPPVNLESFYTRAKKPEDMIKVFARLTGDGNATLVVRSPLQIIEDNLSVQGTLKREYEILISKGNNNITAELFQKGHSSQTISFNVNWSTQSQNQNQNQIDSKNSTVSTKSTKTANSTKAILNKTKHQGLENITSRVVFTSESLKRNENILWILLIAVGLISLFIIIKKLN